MFKFTFKRKRIWKLYEIVNKIQVEKERKYDLLKDNLLRKKLEGKKIFEKNFRRVKFK